MIYYSNSSEFSLKTTMKKLLPRIIIGFVESRNLALGAWESTDLEFLKSLWGLGTEEE
jgi:hypothetical protein